MFKGRRAFIRTMTMSKLDMELMKGKGKMTIESQETVMSREAARSVSRLTGVQRRERGRVKDEGGGEQQRTWSLLCLGSKEALLTVVNSVQRPRQRTAKKWLCGPKPGLVLVNNNLLHRLVTPTLRPSLGERLLLLPDPVPPLLLAGRANPGLSNRPGLLIAHQNNRGSLLRRGRDGQRKPSR